MKKMIWSRAVVVFWLMVLIIGVGAFLPDIYMGGKALVSRDALLLFLGTDLVIGFSLGVFLAMIEIRRARQLQALYDEIDATVKQVEEILKENLMPLPLGLWWYRGLLQLRTEVQMFQDMGGYHFLFGFRNVYQRLKARYRDNPASKEDMDLRTLVPMDHQIGFHRELCRSGEDLPTLGNSIQELQECIRAFINTGVEIPSGYRQSLLGLQNTLRYLGEQMVLGKLSPVVSCRLRRELQDGIRELQWGMKKLQESQTKKEEADTRKAQLMWRIEELDQKCPMLDQQPQYLDMLGDLSEEELLRIVTLLENLEFSAQNALVLKQFVTASEDLSIPSSEPVATVPPTAVPEGFSEPEVTEPPTPVA